MSILAEEQDDCDFGDYKPGENEELDDCNLRVFKPCENRVNPLLLIIVTLIYL